MASEKPRGTLNRWYVGGTNIDTESFIYSPFIQSDIKLNDRFSFLFGGTVDYLEHKQGFAPGVVAFDGSPLDYSKTKNSANFYNVNGSVVFKPTEKSSIYFTYNEGEHFGNNTGGAISRDALSGLKTELFELGANISLLDDKAYLGIALFRQEYTTINQDRSVDTIEADGIEIEFNYQPNRNLFATVGYSLIDSKRTAGFFATSYTAADVPVGGTFTTPTFPRIDKGQTFETPGNPKHLLNALVQYKFDNGFGVQANGVFTSAMEAGYNGGRIVDANGNPSTDAAGNEFIRSAKLGVQYEFDAKVFYEYENWRFELAVFNLTDEENWDLPNTGYANGSAVARAERSYEISVKYSW